MYLSKLELHGFKSFAERTVLHFDPGITAIVGPNGCGKSNIVDAVRWVVGEQRARILRSEKMENVIFNGTSKRRPLGMGEVLLTIENNRDVLPTEYTNVELGRRLYRSGDSEYLMNGVQCRLKDITDLFMDTGMGAGAYSVIELKMIEEILSENAEDRRRLFEEAAGITKYKLRRRQTLGKLDSTQADLTRIRDLTEEIGKNVRSLKRQAARAEQYRSLAERLHRFELALARVEFLRLTQQHDALDTEIQRLQAEIGRAAKGESKDDEALEALRRDLAEREKTLAEKQHDLNVHLEAVRSLETERRLSQERLDGMARELDQARQEQRDAAVRRERLEIEVGELTTRLEAAEPALGQALTELESIQNDRDRKREEAAHRRDALDALKQQERALEQRRNDQRRELDRLVNRRELLEQELERTESRMAELGRTIEVLQGRVSAADESRESAESTVLEARRKLEESAQERTHRQEALQEATNALQRAERRSDALSAEVQLLESMLSSFDEFSGAVQYLAADREWSETDLKTVSDILTCSHQDRIALDAALGPYASCIVVKTDAEAQRAIERLRREEAGRATFIILERLPSSANRTPRIGELAPLFELVRTADPSYDVLARVLLHDAYVVDALEHAKGLRDELPCEARFFARTGEWMEASAIIHGGSRQEGASPLAGRLARREHLTSAKAELEELSRELEEIRRRVDSQKKALEDVPFEPRRQELSSAELHLAEAEKSAARLSFELNAAERRRSELLAQHQSASGSISSIEDQISRLEMEEKESGLAQSHILSRLSEAEKAFEKADADVRSAATKYNESNISAIQARNLRDNLTRDLQRAGEQMEDLRLRFDARTQRIAELESGIGETERTLADLDVGWKTIEGLTGEKEEAVAYADEAVRQTREAILNVETELRGHRRHRDYLIREENQRQIRVAEIQTRSQDLVAHIEEEFSISLPEAVAAGTIEIPEDFEENTARSEVGDLRRQIRSLGAVNELALEAYEAEKERLDFMTKQQEDLERAESKLLETINEINATASRRFLETYEDIRTNFSRLFSDLFGAEAAADLEMENPQDPLETAIEINARPKGKRPSGIAQLSGGEKALTAIALLFAIYLVKPSPFCILDEVDAPLDDANVERFMRLIREFSRETQFILVTHNKRTMEAADRLYGITMQEQGVSRIVGVKFDEAVEIVDRSPGREAA